MNLNYIVVFIVIWWLVFYVTLPFGYKQDAKHKIGFDRSAPKNPHIRNKIVITSLITIILTAIMIVIIKNNWE